MEEKKKYARGKHPNSRKGVKNLIPFNQLSEEKRREICSNGGKKRGANEKQNLIIKNILEKAVAALVKDDATGEELTALEAGTAKLVARYAKKGDCKDLEAIAKHLGQEPAQKVEQLVITPEVDFEKLEMLRKALKGN